jgi:hypothetical protein
MRTPLHGDVVAAARVLRVHRPEFRNWVLRRMLREADRANSRVRRGLPGHRIWGDGSLMTAALRRKPTAEPSLASRCYCESLALVYAVIAARGS